MDFVQLGKRVRYIRRCQDITQEQLAEMAEISTSFVGHIERGTRVLSVQTLLYLCCALNLSSVFLLGVKEHN